MDGSVSVGASGTTVHIVDGFEVGTNTTMGASTPATFIRTFWMRPLPRMAMRHTPSATSAPTNTLWTGV